MDFENSSQRDELRRRAAELLSSKQSINPQEFTENLEDLIENLQVYQIELEMQNQELIRTQEQLSHTKAKFETLFNQAPVGYCTLTFDGDMVDVNSTFAGFVDLDQAKLRGDNIKRFVHPDDQDLLHMHFQKVCRNEDAESVTLRFGSNESYIHVALHSVILDDGDGDTLLCSLSNISREVVYQKELLASDARFRSLISSMDDVVFTMDTQHRHTGVYGRWVQQNNQTPEDFLGKTAAEIFGDEAAKMHNQNTSEALKGKNVVYEWSVSTPNGEEYFQTSLSPIFGENNVVEGVVGLGRNITNLKRTMQSLKESEEKYRNLVENVNDIIYSLSPDGYFNYVSPNWLNILGHNINEVAGRHFSEFVHPDDLEVCKSFLEKVIATGKRQRGVEYRVKHKDGRWRWHHSSGSINLVANGSIEFIGIAYDVTDVKVIQEQLRERIKEIDCLYKITTLGNDTTITLNDFLHKCISIIPSGFLSPQRVAVKICLNSKTFVSPTFTGDLNVMSVPLKTVLGQSGEIQVELLDNNLQFLDEEQTLLNLLAETISQVVERGRVLDEISQTNESLKVINAEKDKILTIIAHDLRGPLSTIIGLSEHMKEAFFEMGSEKQQMFIDGIHKTSTNLSQLLDNLLVWARLKRGNIEFKPKSNNLFQLAENAIVLFEDQLIKKQVHLSNAINKNLHVLADARMVETVFRNIISNAIKFSYRGGGVVVSAKPSHENMVLVSVTDNGVGMDDYILSHLFQFDSEAGREGTEEEPSTGFGMPLCKELVEKNNGQIWAESKEGKESTIFVTLPLA
jgi:PAS domain S-box-containing protein